MAGVMSGRRMTQYKMGRRGQLAKGMGGPIKNIGFHLKGTGKPLKALSWDTTQSSSHSLALMWKTDLKRDKRIGRRPAERHLMSIGE